MKDFLQYVGLASLIIVILNAAYQRRKDTQGDLKEKFKELSDRVEIALTRLTVIETKAEIYFRGMSVSAAAQLHSPHTPELDRLLEKFQHEEIRNEKELYRLKELLKEIADDDSDPLRRKLASDTLLLIHVRFEIGGDLIDKLRKQDKGITQTIHKFSERLNS